MKTGLGKGALFAQQKVDELDFLGIDAVALPSSTQCPDRSWPS